MFFYSFILSHWLHCYLYNYFARTFSEFLKQTKQKLNFNTFNTWIFGVEMDNKLSFEKHISTLDKNASNQLNAIIRIQKFMGFKEKKFF